MTNTVSLPLLYCTQDFLFLIDSMQYFFISHTIGPTDLLHPSPTPHFKTFQVFLICFPVSAPHESYIRNVAHSNHLTDRLFQLPHSVHTNYKYMLCVTYQIHSSRILPFLQLRTTESTKRSNEKNHGRQTRTRLRNCN
jgi:hypothetical protein